MAPLRTSKVIARFPTAPVWPQGTPRALWLEQALAAEGPGDSAAARSSQSLTPQADVCVIGGGFTGLWAALALKRRDPTLTVALLEADICGGGASGRNGGFVMSAWSKFSSLVKLSGEADALRYARACEAAVGAIGQFLEAHGIDGDFRQAGWLWTATNPAQLGAWETAIEAIAAAGAQPYELLTPDEVVERSGSPRHLAGVFEPVSATFHPAKVARGLARVAESVGISVHERTSVRAVHGGAGLRVETDRGVLHADAVLLAVNAWTAALAQARDALVITSSDVIASDRIPEQLDAIGWESGLSISDSRRLVSYYQRSQEGRVIFGKGGGTLSLGGRVGRRFHGPSSRLAEVEAGFRFAYPNLSAVPVTASWRGPIDYSVSGVPFVFPVGGHPRVLAAAGFSGNGCGPAFVVGDALAAMALGGNAENLPEALRRVPHSPLPPEPIRYLGGRLVRAAITRRERIEDRGQAADRLTVRVAGLDPTGFVDRSAASEAARQVPDSEVSVAP